MKKLNLGKLKIYNAEILHRNDMSQLYGGCGGSTHTWRCECSYYPGSYTTFESTDQEAPGYALDISTSCPSNDLHCSKIY